MPGARIRKFMFFVSLSAMIAFFPTLLAAGEPVGHMLGGPSVMEWQIGVNSESIVLNVLRPDGTLFTKEFPAGRNPVFRTVDNPSRDADGTYSYELRVVPRISAEVKKRLQAARDAGNDAATLQIRKDAGLLNQLVQSGAFTIQNGVFVPPDAVEPGSAKAMSVSASSASGSATGASIVSAGMRRLPPVRALDVVTADDEIIQGSLCVGLDCVVNENFGFDTIRLKENNTRVKFEDTSTSTGFPTTDWQLTANDSASGGANKFSIEDITAATVPFTVSGAAPTNSFFVSSAGKLGLGNNGPVLNVHITATDTPAIRQEQTSGGGFTAQTWDIGANEANWFVRDVTGGSRLPLRIRPGAPTSSVDISNSGSVGINTASPNSNAKLDVYGAIRMPGTVYPTTDSGAWLVNEAGVGMAVQSFGTIRLKTGGTTDRVVIDGSGNVGIACNAPAAKLVIASGAGCSTPSSSINPGSAQFTVASSRTFKENLEPIRVPDILQKIDSIPVYTYDFKNGGPKNRLGLVAEDFHQVFERGSDKYIDGSEVQMALWLAVQQLTEKNKDLTDRLAAMEQKLAAQQHAQQ